MFLCLSVGFYLLRQSAPKEIHPPPPMPPGKHHPTGEKAAGRFPTAREQQLKDALTAAFQQFYHDLAVSVMQKLRVPSITARSPRGARALGAFATKAAPRVPR